MTQTFHEYRAAIDAQLDSPIMDFEANLLWGEPSRSGKPVSITMALWVIREARRQYRVGPDRREREEEVYALLNRKGEAEIAMRDAQARLERLNMELYYAQLRLEAHRD